MTAADLAQRLRAVNLCVGKVREPDDLEDGEIVLSDTLHIQVGPNYFCLLLKTPQGKFRYFDPRRSFKWLLNDLRRLAQDPTVRDRALRQALRRISSASKA